MHALFAFAGVHRFQHHADVLRVNHAAEQFAAVAVVFVEQGLEFAVQFARQFVVAAEFFEQIVVEVALVVSGLADV